MTRAALIALLGAGVLTGCMLPFCGPTVYHLTGLTASAYVDAPWDASKARDGLRAAGFEPQGESEWSAAGSNATAYMGADGGSSARFRVYWGFSTEGVQGSHADVEREAGARIDARRAEAGAAFAAYARATGWTLSEPMWDKGLLHGDC